MCISTSFTVARNAKELNKLEYIVVIFNNITPVPSTVVPWEREVRKHLDLELSHVLGSALKPTMFIKQGGYTLED